MNENQANSKNLIDTTDSLEAVNVFRGWKNFLFVITAICLILLQISFWLVNTGLLKADGKSKSSPATLGIKDKEQTNEETAAHTAVKPEEPNVAAQLVIGTPNQLTETSSAQKTLAPHFGPPFFVKRTHLSLLIRLLDFVVIITATLYCLTMLFTLKVSMLGRLGGINHIARAFFLSLVMLVLLLPWQRYFGNMVTGALYTPVELWSSRAVETGGIFTSILYYLRFTGYWALVVVLLILSQLRSARWAKATLRRLEVI